MQESIYSNGVTGKVSESLTQPYPKPNSNMNGAVAATKTEFNRKLVFNSHKIAVPLRQETVTFHYRVPTFLEQNNATFDW